MASIFEDALQGINDIVSGVGNVATNVANQVGSIYTSLADVAKASIANDTVGANQNNAKNNPANGSTLTQYLTADNIIIAGGVVLFVIAVVNLVKK